MAAPNLTINTRSNTTCDGLLFDDTTVYSGGTILSSTVTSVNLKLDYSTLGTSIRYTFTVANNVITASHLILLDGSSTDILSQISTVFPFTGFGLTKNYGKTIPKAIDGVYVATYEILGNSGGAYDYTITQQVLLQCSTNCCVSKMFQELGEDCGCSDAKWMTAMRAGSYLSAARYCTDVGNIDNAVAALNKASSICQKGCGC